MTTTNMTPEWLAEKAQAEARAERAEKYLDKVLDQRTNESLLKDKAMHQLYLVEKERDALITALGAGVSDCPYLTFWADGAALEIPDWCTCSDTDEYGFECNVDAKDCWLKYAQQQAEKQGEQVMPDTSKELSKWKV